MSNMKHEFFAFLDTGTIVPIEGAATYEEAFDRDMPNAHWVHSRDGLVAALASGLKALDPDPDEQAELIADLRAQWTTEREHLLGLIDRAESFIAGFEGDDCQSDPGGIDDLLEDMRNATGT
jgi:hypothetical protein